MDTLMGRYRNVSILAAAIFLQIVGLAVQVKRHAENRSTRLIRVWAIDAITPIETNIVRLQTGFSGIWQNYIFLRGVRQENRQLHEQIQQLQLEQVRLRQDAEQARRLQSLLGFKEQFVDKTLAAQVIGSSGSEQSRIVYLDKGSADGIVQDMAVISAQGVVGKVIQVFRHTSQVLLVNDQTSGVGTILEQSRLQGVLKGKASGELVLDKIMPEEEVKDGERVLTSGGDQIFPKGLTVGTVANVRRAGEFMVVTVQPAAALNHLEEVLVITRKLEREPEISAATPVRAADILAERLPSVPDAPPSTAGASANGAAKKPATTPSGAIKLPSTANGVTPGQPTIQHKVQNSEALEAPSSGASGNTTAGGITKPAAVGTQTQSQKTAAQRAHVLPAAAPLKITPSAVPSPAQARPATGTQTSAESKAPASGQNAAKSAPTQPAKPLTPQSPKPSTNTAPTHSTASTTRQVLAKPASAPPAKPTSTAAPTQPTSTGDVPQ